MKRLLPLCLFACLLSACADSSQSSESTQATIEDFLQPYSWQDSVIHYRIDSNELVLTFPNPPQIPTLLIEGALVDTTRSRPKLSDSLVAALKAEIAANGQPGPEHPLMQALYGQSEMGLPFGLRTVDNGEVRIPLEKPINFRPENWGLVLMATPRGKYFFKKLADGWHFCDARFRYFGRGEGRMALLPGYMELNELWVADSAEVHRCQETACNAELLRAVMHPTEDAWPKRN